MSKSDHIDATAMMMHSAMWNFDIRIFVAALVPVYNKKVLRPKMNRKSEMGFRFFHLPQPTIVHICLLDMFTCRDTYCIAQGPR